MRLDPHYITNLSTQLDQSAQRLSDITAEMSSGLRVSQLSTDPTVTSTNTLLNTAIAQQDTYVQVAGTETGRLQVADSALSETVSQLTTAIGLGTQASNGTLNTANRAAIQEEVKGIRDTVLSLANSTYTGTYLFAGSNATTKPFALNTASDPATFTYASDSKVQSIVTPGGQTISIGLSGQSVFGSALTALNQLVSDLGPGGSSANLPADTSSVSTALSQLGGQRAIISNSLNRLQTTSSYAQTQIVNLKVTQSGLVSVDFATAATELSATTTQHQALLQVIAGLGKSSLFDYIK